ncbi:MAG TPA: hypothetical protein VFK72_00520 [Nevskia sp.]|nr:hypothetical protein [Nevskia sp.]
MPSPSIRWLLVLLTVLAPTVLAAPGDRLGAPVVIAASSDSNPDVARNRNGAAVVTWTGPLIDGSTNLGDTLLAQRIAADGSLQGGVIAVRDRDARGGAGNPRVAIDASGGFVVVWEHTLPFVLPSVPFVLELPTLRISPEIRARRFTPDGVPAGNEFIVALRGNSPHVAVDDVGNLVVVWAVDGTLVNATDGYPYPTNTPRVALADRIESRRYFANGTAQGPAREIDRSPRRPLLLNDRAPPLLVNPSVAMDSTGRHVVAWTSRVDGQGIFAQAFDAVGDARGPRYLVSEGPNGVSAQLVSLAMNRDGAHAATWANGANVVLRHYDTSGAALTAAFTPPPRPDGSIAFGGEPRIGIDDAGNVALCSSDGGNFAQRRVSLQLFRANGTPLTAALPASLGPTPPPSPLQYACSVAMRGDGESLLVYATRGTLYAQRFAGP